ncbi:hypothetical protein [Peribacillus frigoritolerans]|uniref:hypothetical protein n=1 Tax=Peribacillus frigoritolerans TaxID=450367 RepID=UPI001070DAC9|nr:hypothetical protein [Peribacillus frigoritolerans]TFH61207.1 hypothetical protein E4J71_12875 [Peribacillus frigoritolerans]
MGTKSEKFKQIVMIVSLSLLIVSPLIIHPIITAKLEERKVYNKALLALEEPDYVVALRYFEKVADYKDSRKKMDAIYLEISKLVPEMIEKEMFYGGTYLYKYLFILSDVPKYEQQAQEMNEAAELAEAENLVEERAKLSVTVPYEGMFEKNIEFSSWGKPTEINKEHHYDSLTEERRVKHYKWVEKDELGRTRTIKSLMVQQGAVWGEPQVHQYYQNN